MCRSLIFSRLAASICVICFCWTSCSTRSRSRSRWLKAIRSVSIAPPATYESGHFYFAQTGHSHFAATSQSERLSHSVRRARFSAIFMAQSVYLPGLAIQDSEVLDVPRHSVLVRITHWIHAVSFIALVVSGIGILLSHPRFYWGETGGVGGPSLFDLPLP